MAKPKLVPGNEVEEKVLEVFVNGAHAAYLL
jgi:hypothetical protein